MNFKSNDGTSCTALPRQVSLVLNAVVIDSAILPFELAEGAILDQATPEEIKRFKELLANLTGNSLFSHFCCFENEVKIQHIGDGTRYDYVPLDSSRWRYYVIRTTDNGTKIIDLDLIGKIIVGGLDCGSISFMHAGGSTHRTFSLAKYHGSSPSSIKTLTEEHLNELRDLYLLKIRVAGTATGECGPFPEIGRALQMLTNLENISPNSLFLVLGLFGIIEMLVTHNPKLEDRGDSITHQMKGKIPLLSRRFDIPLPYDKYFGETSTDKVWSSLYAYRSAVAHGGMLSFEKAPFSVLRGQLNADAFLLIVVQSLIRHSLRDPNLYRDIKNC